MIAHARRVRIKVLHSDTCKLSPQSRTDSVPATNDWFKHSSTSNVEITSMVQLTFAHMSALLICIHSRAAMRACGAIICIATSVVIHKHVGMKITVGYLMLIFESQTVCVESTSNVKGKAMQGQQRAQLSMRHASTAHVCLQGSVSNCTRCGETH